MVKRVKLGMYDKPIERLFWIYTKEREIYIPRRIRTKPKMRSGLFRKGMMIDGERNAAAALDRRTLDNASKGGVD